MPSANQSIQNKSADPVLEKIKGLAPTIAARAGEAESAARVPADIWQMLKSAGIFRMTAPKTHGGMELDYPTVARILQTITRIDGSVGWVCTLANGGALFFTALEARDL